MKRSRLLTRLWEFQNDFGYIPNNAISEIAQELRVSKIEIEGVISFYHFFHRQPTGKFLIYLSNSIISEFKGFQEVKTSFEKETDCSFGNYSKNKLFSLFETSCIGLSDQEPAALINSYPFTNLTPEKVSTIIQQLKNGVSPATIADNPNSKIQYTPNDEKTIFFRKYSLGNSLKKLEHQTPFTILKALEEAQLGGRGGAFFDTAKKWRHCKNNPCQSKYIICNADEGEPGTFKDKALLNKRTGLVIEGMILAGFVCNSEKGIMYLRAEYKYLQAKIEATLAEFRNRNLLGKNIAGIENFNFDIEVALGAGAYVCGAETALIESLEGKRGEPRVRTYYPTEYGYKNHSTVVNNVETFAMAARIVEYGSSYISNIGTPKSKGTKLLSVSGDVAKPGIYEVEWGISIQEILHLCQATAPYYIQISGPSGECLNSNEFDKKICKEDIACGGSIMIFNRYRSILQILENFAKFFNNESCGGCTPCRAGNQIILEKIKSIKQGICTSKDLKEIQDWAQIMKLTSKCGLGQFAGQSFTQAIDKFKDYFNLKVTTCDENCSVEFNMEEAVFDYDHLIKTTQPTQLEHV